MLVKNDYLLHSKFELHRYQQMNGFLYWLSFYWKKYGAYMSHELIFQLILTWIWYDLPTVIHFWSSNYRITYFFWFYQFKQHNNVKALCYRAFLWCYYVHFEQVKCNNNERKSKKHEIFFFDKLDQNLYKIWSSRCCQLHRLAHPSTSTRRYTAWRQNWNICLTMVKLWLCLRFKNTEVKYLRKRGICIPKYIAEHLTYSALQYWELTFF